MCDTKCNNNNSRCGGDNNMKSIEGPPQNLPSWFRCPPPVRERNYPVPEGVNILPISVGGRNGPAKKQFKCGQCGQDARPKKDTKPNVSADCPMVKARCPGLMEQAADKVGEGKGSVVDRIKNFFGGKDKEDLRLVEACKALRVEDDHIRHHRDVFSSQLFWSKGYYSPFAFFTKVDCQGKPEGNCTCRGGVQEVVKEEENEEVVEEQDGEVLEDEECEEENGEEYNYAEIEEVEVEQEEDCDEDWEQGGEEAATEDAGGEEQFEEEECVEDAEGECIVEESAECMDDDCKLSFEESSPQKKGTTIFDEFCNCMTDGQENKKNCTAMNNFIIRVSTPLKGASTNETCEQIIERLTKTNPKYPEPEPRKEKKAQDSNTKEDIEIVVKQISVQKPTCECPPKCKDPPPPPPPPPSKNDCEKPPPQQQQPKDNCEKPAELAQPCTCSCGEEPPPEVDNSEKPPAPTDECPRPRAREPPPNDCTTLTEDELLHKPIKEINCGCSKFLSSKCTSDTPGASYAGENSVWIPPPPPPCARCGASERGATEGCYPCQLTRRMRSGIPEVNGCNLASTDLDSLMNDVPTFDRCADRTKKPAEPDCTPEFLPDGSIKYKGGMCQQLANAFLWHVFKRNPRGGFFDRYSGECGEEARLQAATGTNSFSEALSACSTRNADGVTHRGGDSVENTNRFLWGEKQQDEEGEINKRECKPPPPKEGKGGGGGSVKANQCPPP